MLLHRARSISDTKSSSMSTEEGRVSRDQDDATDHGGVSPSYARCIHFQCIIMCPEVPGSNGMVALAAPQDILKDMFA